MRTFLSEAETLLEIRKCCRRATRIRAALALITCSGLRLIEDDLEGLLARGGEVQVLLGTDMATEPEAIEALLNLQEQYSGRLTVRRYASNTSQTFHPKAWLFSFRSGPGSAVVGSSNLTQGGFDRNLEAMSSMLRPGPLRCSDLAHLNIDILPHFARVCLSAPAGVKPGDARMGGAV